MFLVRRSGYALTMDSEAFNNTANPFRTPQVRSAVRRMVEVANVSMRVLLRCLTPDAPSCQNGIRYMEIYVGSNGGAIHTAAWLKSCLQNYHSLQLPRCFSRVG